jgi:hypothetical protein
MIPIFDAFNANISAWNVSSVTRIDDIFRGSTLISLHGTSGVSPGWIICSVMRLHATLTSLHGTSGASPRFLHTQPTDRQHTFEVHLEDASASKTYKDFVSVSIEQGKSEHFLNSVRRMGDFIEGRRFGRDGETGLDDVNDFGQEWQVLDTEPTLFQTVRFPQHPQ